MSQDTLFSLPESSPPLFDLPATHRPKLEVWKERHGVWTHHSPDMETPWLACAAERFIKHYDVKPEDATSMGALYAKWGRLVDESGCDGDGMTEEEACLTLAEKQAWPFLESITPADCRIAARPTP